MTDRITRLEDLAALAGVSTATASRALSDDGAVSAATRQRIVRLARAHGYRGAKSDAAGILLLVDGGDDPITAQFVTALIAASGTAIQIERIDDLAQTVRAHRGDGMVIIDHGGRHETLNALAATEDRFVVFGPKRAGQAYPSIGASDGIGGRRALLHLARAGRRRIAFIGDTRHEAVMQRYRGYLDAHEAAGLAPDPGLTITDVGGFEGGEGAVARLATPDAIFAADDIVALGAIRALRGADVAVVGFGDLPAGRWATPALSTIACDVDRAATAIVAMLAGPANRLSALRLPAGVVVRESCGGAAAAPLSGGG